MLFYKLCQACKILQTCSKLGGVVPDGVGEAAVAAVAAVAAGTVGVSVSAVRPWAFGQPKAVDRQ